MNDEKHFDWYPLYRTISDVRSVSVRKRPWAPLPTQALEVTKTPLRTGLTEWAPHPTQALDP